MKFNELDFIKEFPITTNDVLAKKYSVGESTIRTWGARLGLNKKTWLWSRNDENYILRNYNKKTSVEIAKKLGRTRWSIINKYRELSGLRKKSTK